LQFVVGGLVAGEPPIRGLTRLELPASAVRGISGLRPVPGLALLEGECAAQAQGVGRDLLGAGCRHDPTAHVAVSKSGITRFTVWHRAFTFNPRGPFRATRPRRDRCSLRKCRTRSTEVDSPQRDVHVDDDRRSGRADDGVGATSVAMWACRAVESALRSSPSIRRNQLPTVRSTTSVTADSSGVIRESSGATNP